MTINPARDEVACPGHKASMDGGRMQTRSMIPDFFFLFLFFFKVLFIYWTERDTVREGTAAGGVGEGEAGFLLSREPDVGLDPRTLGS